ncbi:MAG: MinD/ParA family protein [Gammaproteobacteria bacterium]|nr:MinD/ParA family protein [Gammaproteobacteria bacterium]
MGSSGPKSAKIIAITSGKGGVGKTSLTVNTGIALAQQGYKVCLFDADSNLANINIMLKVMPEFTLEHVLKGEKSIHGIMIQRSGISLVPGASGITDFDKLQRVEKQRLIYALSKLEREYDYILVDTSAGIHDNVLSFIETAQHCIVVITPEPTSLTDAFSLVRVLKKRGYKKRLNVVVNLTASELNARKTYKRFSMAVAKYIGCKVAYLGFVLKDELLSEAICAQNPVIIETPAALSSRCFERLSKTLDRLSSKADDEKGLSVFWQKEQADQLPDFSTPETGHFSRHKLRSAALLTKRQMLVEHKYSILNYIDDPDMTREEVTDTLTGFLDTYFKRFNSYPVDVAKMLSHSLEHNDLAQSDINELLSSLQLFYKDNFSKTDKDASAQYICQLINSYVDQYKSFPFDTIYALYQSLDLGDVERDRICNLLFTLNLIYQGRDNEQAGKLHEAHNMVYCAEKNNEELEQLTMLIQNKYLNDFRQKINVDSVAQVNKDQHKPASAAEVTESLLDSIKYASLTD